MSVYAARGESDLYAFYDADPSVAVIWQDLRCDPSIIVEHEITHVNLVKRSSLGLLEQVLAFVAWQERLLMAQTNADDGSPGLRRALDLIQSLRRLTVAAHEAVAWFNTEVFASQGHATPQTPSVYRKDTERLWDLVRRGGGPFKSTKGHLGELMTIAEAVGVIALSPPSVVHTMTEWLVTDEPTGDDLHSALGAAGGSPLDRFRDTCRELRGQPFASLLQWASSVLEASKSAAPQQTQLLVSAAYRGPMDAAPERWVFPIIRAEWVGAVEGRAGPGYFAQKRSDEELDRQWRTFSKLVLFSEAIDRFAQTCVIQPGRDDSTRASVSTTLTDALSASLTSGFALGVTRGIMSSESFGHYHAHAAIPSALSLFPHSTDAEQAAKSWLTHAATAGEFLATTWQTAPPIVVSGIGYDFARGDFADSPVLENIPHVVIVVSDFKALWLTLSVGGLAGERSLSWQNVAPLEDTEPSPFGYLAIRADGAHSPLVLLPCVSAFAPRIVSISGVIPSGNGVTLANGSGPLDEWLGPMVPACIAAARAWELQCRRHW